MSKHQILKFSLLILVAGAALVGSSLVLGNFRQTGSPVSIVETDKGFEPAVVTIRKGQQVVFTTTRGKQFWPASDLHPTHEIYAAFDPKQPIESDASWSFTFNKVGEWKFHDHLYPLYRGTIKVVDGDPAEGSANLLDAREESAIDICDLLPDKNNKLQCWDEGFRVILKEQGLKVAFDLLADLFKSSPDFASQCHVITHTIGEAAYHQFSETGAMEPGLETSYCGFGFFHGFMEALFADGNGPELARKLCDYLDTQVSGSTNRATLACFHGIGHGAADGSAEQAWGNEEAFVRPALELCEKIAQNYNEKFNCATGAFNSLSIAYISNQHGMVLDKKDPLWICKKQSQDTHKMGCYNDMMVAIVNLADHDIVKGASYLNTVEDPYASSSVRYVTALTVKYRLQDSDYTDVIRDCRQVQKRLQNDCISGFGSGLMEFGEPGVDYIKALAFCKLPGLLEKERETCIKRVLSYAYTEYSKEKMTEICAMVDESYWTIPSCKPEPRRG